MISFSHNHIRFLKPAAPTLYAIVTPHGSRSHLRAFEVGLQSATIAEGEKRRTQSAYGAIYSNDETGAQEYSATWAEYGWFFAALFAADKSMSEPRLYVDRAAFHEATLNVFDSDVEHYAIEASMLQADDIIVGYGVAGSGLRTVLETPRVHHNRDGSVGRRSFIVELEQQTGWNGSYYTGRHTESVPMKPQRQLTVARYRNGE